jgi:hypothetical protein
VELFIRFRQTNGAVACVGAFGNLVETEIRFPAAKDKVVDGFAMVVWLGWPAGAGSKEAIVLDIASRSI